MKVLMAGIRGLCDVQGGIETHVRQLAPLLVARGVQVTVLERSPFWSKTQEERWQGVGRKRLWSPTRKGVEAFVHTFLSVVYAIARRPDIMHIHAIGPGLFVPLARLGGLRVVFTHHGRDYEREKWGPVARTLLRIGEMLAVRFADCTICVSAAIKSGLEPSGPRAVVVIPNGMPRLAPVPAADELARLRLTARKYIVMVSRFVPEKRHLDLVQAFRSVSAPDWKLVLVGRSDETLRYSESVRRAADADSRVILVGHKSGSALWEIFSNAGLFVLPSSHEGLPIALLEALALGLPVAVSDIAAHRELALPEEAYFAVGDVDALRRILVNFTSRQEPQGGGRPAVGIDLQRYDWDRIADKTFEVYQSIVSAMRTS
jgi:glycosyltransferase involved in cell wall biosynthesis